MSNHIEGFSKSSLDGLVGKEVVVKVKWGVEVKGTLVCIVDNENEASEVASHFGRNSVVGLEQNVFIQGDDIAYIAPIEDGAKPAEKK